MSAMEACMQGALPGSHMKCWSWELVGGTTKDTILLKKQLKWESIDTGEGYVCSDRPIPNALSTH